MTDSLPATDPQIGYIRRLARDAGLSAGELRDVLARFTAGRVTDVMQLNRDQAGRVIGFLKGDLAHGVTPEDRQPATRQQKEEIRRLGHERLGLSPTELSAITYQAVPERTPRYALSQRDADIVIARLQVREAEKGAIG